jgi:hypothetical protein
MGLQTTRISARSLRSRVVQPFNLSVTSFVGFGIYYLQVVGDTRAFMRLINLTLNFHHLYSTRQTHVGAHKHANCLLNSNFENIIEGGGNADCAAKSDDPACCSIMKHVERSHITGSTRIELSNDLLWTKCKMRCKHEIDHVKMQNYLVRSGALAMQSMCSPYN